MSLRTLAERNATPTRRDWDKYTLETRVAVGHNGRQRGARGRTGSHMHLLFLEVVVADRDPKPGTYKVGDVFSSHGSCGGNGQHTAAVVEGLDVDAVTCSKCLRNMVEAAPRNMLERRDENRRNARALTATTPRGTFTRKTARTYTHVVVVRAEATSPKYRREGWFARSWTSSLALATAAAERYAKHYPEVEVHPVGEAAK